MRLYKDKAKIYDKFIECTGKDYSTETAIVSEIIKKELTKSKIKLLDLGCGTGHHAVEFKKNGFDVICADLNEEILEIAKKRTGLPCMKIDMRDFSLPQKVDAITCMFNTITYTNGEEELKETFKSCYANLKDNGIFIMQITNPDLIKKAKDFSFVWDVGDDYKVVQIDILKLPKLIHYFVITDLKNGECIVDQHDTTIFQFTTIKKKLNEAGFCKIDRIDKGAVTYVIAKKKS